MMIRIVLLAVMALSPSLASAANHYVRQGATGDGSDWQNAYSALPPALVRGDVYYVATGTYPGYTFDDAQSGTTYITIKRATVGDHGTSAGWNDAYASGQAVFGPLLVPTVDTGYYLIDGQSAYGIKVMFGDGQVGLDFGRGVPGFQVKYVEFAGPGGSVAYPFIDATRGIDVTPWNGFGWDVTDNLLISHCAIHGAETLIQLAAADHLTVEYSDLYDSRTSNDGLHQNVLYIQESQNGTFRYNRVHNFEAEGVFFTYGNSFINSANWNIYGNVFYDGVGSARGVETHQDGGPWGPIYIFNNTFVGMPFYGVALRGPSVPETRVENNLFFDSALDPSDEALHDYNWSTDANTEPNGVANGTNPFVNSNGRNFHLSSASSARNHGVALAAPYTLDPDGQMRGADGAWDIGAFECANACPALALPSAPTNVQTTH